MPAHQTVLALLSCGLGYSEAQRISYEDALCLLACKAHCDELEWLDREAARIASLSFADPDEQQKHLLALRHRARRAVERFELRD